MSQQPLSKTRMPFQEETNQDILEILGGVPIDAGVSVEQLHEIRQATDGFVLKDVLEQLQDSAVVALIISWLPNLSASDVELLLQKVLQALEVIELEWIWSIDEFTVTQSQYTTQLNFKEQVKKELALLKEIVNTRYDVIEGYRFDIIVQVSYYYLETPWCDLRSSQIANEILSKAPIQDETIDKLINILKPQLVGLRNTNLSEAGYKKLNSNQGLRPELGHVQAETRRYIWKSNNIKSISMFKFILLNLSATRIKEYWWMISPAILNILDDHEGMIKLQGVKLLSILLPKIDDSFLNITGLLDIFYKALEPLLSYLPKLTPTKESCLIQKETYPVIISLLQKIQDKEVYRSKLIGLLNSSVFHSIGLISDNFLVLNILVQQIEVIVKELKMSTVKALPRLLYTIGNILSNPFIYTDPPLFQNSLGCLTTIILNAWPRIKGHKYDILGMVVISYRNQNESYRIEHQLVIILRLLRQVMDYDQDITKIVEKFPETKSLFDNV